MRLLMLGAIGALLMAATSCADHTETALRTNDGILIYQPSGGFGSPSAVPC